MIAIFKESDNLVADKHGVSFLQKSFELIPVKFHIAQLDLVFVFTHAFEEVLQLGVISKAQVFDVFKDFWLRSDRRPASLFSLFLFLILVLLIIFTDFLINTILIFQHLYV